jgi:predicted enzyme related to lactoylglutathione lyase
MPTVEHFDFVFDDSNRAQTFYKDVFGWSMQKNESENPEMEYWHFETNDLNGNKGITGGMMKRQSPDHSIINYITVSSINEYVSKIERSGGKIKIPRTEIPGMGYISIFTDTENNTLGLFELKT